MIDEKANAAEKYKYIETFAYLDAACFYAG
jgi:hypothetical protein